MYFPHAFKKSYLLPSGTLTLASGVTTSSLTAGQIGMYAPNGANLNATTSTLSTLSASTKPFYVVGGSYFTKDTIGAHGGYKETWKSKLINPRFISRVIKVNAKTAKNHVVQIDPQNATGTGTGNPINSNTTYRLRVDVKGSPALRFLNHQLYRTFDAYYTTGSATAAQIDPRLILIQWKEAINNYPTFKEFVQAKVWDINATTTLTAATTSGTSLAVTSATGFSAGYKVIVTSSVATSAASVAPDTQYIVGYVKSTYTSGLTIPLVDASGVDLTFSCASSCSVRVFTQNTTAYSSFVPGTVTSVDSHLELTGGYVDTTFNIATFTPTDAYNVEPVIIYASVVDDSGNPAMTATTPGRIGWIDSYDTIDNVNLNNNATAALERYAVQRPVQVSGLGETVMREMIIAGRYLQNAYPDSSRIDSFRMREIEADPMISSVTRTSLYDQYLILHNVPRWNNPTGMFDNDQYLLQFFAPTGADVSALTTYMTTAANAAQGTNAIFLETY